MCLGLNPFVWLMSCIPLLGVYALAGVWTCSKTQKSLEYLSYEELLALSKKGKSAVPVDGAAEGGTVPARNEKEQRRFRHQCRNCALLMNRKFRWAVRLLLAACAVKVTYFLGLEVEILGLLYAACGLVGLFLIFFAMMDVS